jgi:hypothetical protein
MIGVAPALLTDKASLKILIGTQWYGKREEI